MEQAENHTQKVDFFRQLGHDVMHFHNGLEGHVPYDDLRTDILNLGGYILSAAGERPVREARDFRTHLFETPRLHIFHGLFEEYIIGIALKSEVDTLLERNRSDIIGDTRYHEIIKALESCQICRMDMDGEDRIPVNLVRIGMSISRMGMNILRIGMKYLE